jgi:hypothetical protein
VVREVGALITDRRGSDGDSKVGGSGRVVAGVLVVISRSDLGVAIREEGSAVNQDGDADSKLTAK